MDGIKTPKPPQETRNTLTKLMMESKLSMQMSKPDKRWFGWVIGEHPFKPSGTPLFKQVPDRVKSSILSRINARGILAQSL